MDILGSFLKCKFYFKGIPRLIKFWENHFTKNKNRIAFLPEKLKVNVDLNIPYERIVYLQREEWNELLYIAQKLKKGDTFIDVGANIGIWTLVAAKKVGMEGGIFSFEPNPKTFKKLKDNIILNQLQNVSVDQVAVTDTPGSVFFHCASNHNTSSIKEEISVSNETIKVSAINLDSLSLKTKIDGIKIDTEGYELNVLKGAINLLRDQRPFLIIEFNTTLLTSNVLADWDVYNFLTIYNYKPFLYNKSGEEKPLEPSFSKKGYINILFKPVY